MFTPRDMIPPNAQKYVLAKKGGIGLVNLGGPAYSLKNEIQDIDDYDKIFIQDDEIYINFPCWEMFYKEKYFKKGGFTLGDIIELISFTGYIACGKAFIGDNTIFSQGMTLTEAAESVGEFGLCEFEYENNNIYVNVEH